MKFLTYAMLIASAAAIRMQSGHKHQPVMKSKGHAKMHSMTKAVSKMMAKDDDEADYEDLEAWFVNECHSDDGLTKDEFFDKLQDIADEHGYTPTPHDWQMVGQAFDNVDVDGDGSISPEEFAAAMG